ncbi:MAG: hypothetical protein ACI31R_00335 [Bacilli bacterium]
MNKKRNENTFELYSNDINVVSLLKQMKLQSKLYKRINDSLQILGNFGTRIEMNIYEVAEKENGSIVTLWCMDLDDNLFVICPFSTNKKDLSIISRETNEEYNKYDLSLSKNYELNETNINLTKTSKILGTKFGRLITDEHTFYNLFLGNNIIYQIELAVSNNKNINGKDLVSKINEFNDVPSLADYIKAFDLLLRNNNIDTSSITIGAYKNFEQIGYMHFDDNNSENTKVNSATKSK